MNTRQGNGRNLPVQSGPGTGTVSYGPETQHTDKSVPEPAARRLRRIRGFVGLSQRALADMIRMHHQTYVYYENENKFTEAELPLEMRFDLRRVLTGKLPQRILEECLPIAPDMSDIRSIPILNWVQAGQPAEVWEASMADYPQHHMINEPGRLFALRVVGTSMSRVAAPESIIVVNYDDKTPLDGQLYVARNPSGETTFKRYRASPPRLEPDSLEPGHETLFGEFDIIGRVISVTTRF